MIEHAYLIKGWLLDKDPPKEVRDALAAIIAGISDTIADLEQINRIDTKIAALSIASEAFSPPEPIKCDPALKPQEEPNGASPTPPSPRKGWTPERKAAQAEIMRKAREAKAAKKLTGASDADSGPTPVFTEAELRITVSKPARKSHLTDTDWPEIKQMIAAGRSRAAIASDYDEELEVLDHFIASCQRRETKLTGEALAPLPSGVAGATRPTW